MWWSGAVSHLVSLCDRWKEAYNRAMRRGDRWKAACRRAREERDGLTQENGRLVNGGLDAEVAATEDLLEREMQEAET